MNAPKSQVNAARATRRGILAGAASLASLTLPARAADASDAELIRLGNELVASYPEYVRSLFALNEICDRAWGLAEQRTGIKHPGPDGIRFMAPGAFDTLFRAMTNAQDELAMDGLDQAHRKVSFIADNLMNRIGALSASGLAGVAAKAIAAAYMNDDLWDGPISDMDFGRRQVRLLIEATFALCGIRNFVAEAHYNDLGGMA